MAESGAPFAHLHVHTEYSMLDGAARLKDLFAEVKSQGMTHVAMTDHGNMFAAAVFHPQASRPALRRRRDRGGRRAESRRNTNRVWGASRTRRKTTFPPPAPTSQDHLGPGQPGPQTCPALLSL